MRGWKVYGIHWILFAERRIIIMKKVLITGAAGYIGRHVVKEFLDHGYIVYANDLNNKGIDDRATIIDCPIFDGNKDIFSRLGEPDILVHLAWRDGFIHNSNAHMEDLSKHMIFLNNMMAGGLKSISVMGSMHEVGYWEGPIDENTPCNPMSMYGVAKNALRQALLLKTRNSDVVVHWLRAYYIYGDDMRGSSIFSKIVQAAEDGKEEFPFTSGENQYDFIHIDELAKQIYYASVQDKEQGIINVCSGVPVPLKDQVEKFIRDKKLNISLKYGAYPDREYDSPKVWGNPERINRIMGVK